MGSSVRKKGEEIDSRVALAAHTRFDRWHRFLIRMAEFVLQPASRLLRTESAPPLEQVRTILILEQGRLGDVVLLTPFLQALRDRFPKAHIAILGRGGLRDLVLTQNLVDELIPIEVPWASCLPRWKSYNPFSSAFRKFVRGVFRLRRRDFDLAFVAGLGDIRHNFVLLLAGARRRVAYGFAGGEFFLTDVVEPDLTRTHRADLSLRLLAYLGIPETRLRPFLSPQTGDVELGNDFLAKYGVREGDLIVGIHPGAGAAIKEWGENRFREVAEKIVKEFAAKVIWFAEPGKAAGSFFSGNNSIVPAVLPLTGFLAVLSRCDIVVCNDSGPMHMAAGLGIPVVAIFGPELPEWYGPLGLGHRIVIRKEMWCRPCWQRCRFEEPYCLRLISVDEVMQAVEETLKPLTHRRIGVEARA